MTPRLHEGDVVRVLGECQITRGRARDMCVKIVRVASPDGGAEWIASKDHYGIVGIIQDTQDLPDHALTKGTILEVIDARRTNLVFLAIQRRGYKR